MKKNYFRFMFLFIFLVTFVSNAQVRYTGLEKTYTESMDSLLTYVNKQQVSTGILYDRVMPFAHLDVLPASARLQRVP